MCRKIVLIDGNSILNRAFYGIPALTNKKGLPTNAVYGFLNIMFKILEEETPEYLAVAFDVKHPTFRHEKYAQYKGTRKPMPEELVCQLPVIKDVLSAMGIAILEKPGYEADDILGTLAVKSAADGLLVSLVSGDRDLLQLASDKVKIRIPKTKQGKTEVEDYYNQQVIEKYEITPAQIIDLKGLMGDASDNIPGVPGIGEKTAIKILKEFSTIENAYAHVEDIKPNKAKESLKENYSLAVLSKELATIKTDCDLAYEPENALLGNIFNEQAYHKIKELEFKTILKRFDFDMTNHNKDAEASFLTILISTQAEQIVRELSQLSQNQDFSLGACVFQKTEEEMRHPAGSDGQYTFLQASEKTEDGLLGVSLAYQRDGVLKVVFIKGQALERNNGRLAVLSRIFDQASRVYTIDLKKQLSRLVLDKKENIVDLSIAAYLLNPLKDSYEANDLARDYLDMDIPAFVDLFGKKTWGEAGEEEAFPLYCCYGAYTAYEAGPRLLAELKNTDMEKLFCQVEMPLVFTLYDMEKWGVRVNKKALGEYGERLVGRICELEERIHQEAGEDFNINSPKQLGPVLFEKLKLPYGKKTKTGYSTSADVLEKLRGEHPIIDLILEYRQLTKLKSTYADGLAGYILEDGRIHTKFNQTITATGRLSSTEPNLQNIPIRMELGREIRKVFIPEDGFVFLDADYSQIELRVLAHMSDDQKLIAAYREEQDIHKITASEVFHTPLDQVTPAQRSNAKAVNFGIVYGISSFGLGQGLNITRKEAQNYIERYFETYPRVREFLDELVESGKKNGYAASLFQRRRPIPELSSRNFMQRSFGERIAMNSPVQGTAADIIKIAMIRVNQALKKKNLKSRLILQIHDELLVETHKDEIEKVKKIMEEEMFHAARLSVPLEVEVKQGDSWYDSK